MSSDMLEIAGTNLGVDVTELRATTPSKERILLSCPTCKRGLALLGSGTIIVPEALLTATCQRCVRLDKRYQADTEGGA